MELQPEKYPRRILLAVTGGSPQVVTETLYALAVEREPAFVPTEIHVISTSTGLERITGSLLDGETGHFHRLVSDYGLPGHLIRFDESTLHPIRDESGNPLADIDGVAENRAAADQIMDRVRELAADQGAAIHASIAGGRKTMGFFLGYAMSLLGREQDSLSHVLVNEPFETCREFFYPPPKPGAFQTRSGDTVSSDKARVMLAEIPFLRMAHSITLERIKAGDSYSQAVQRLQDAIDEPRLEIDLDARSIKAHGKKLNLAPSNIAFLALFAIRAMLERPWMRMSGNESAAIGQLLPIIEVADVARMDAVYELAAAEETDAVRKRIGNLLSRYRTRLNEALEENLGELADNYMIARPDKRRPLRYGLPLKPDQVRIHCEGIDRLIEVVRFEMEDLAIDEGETK